jgi:hypothetical protein
VINDEIGILKSGVTGAEATMTLPMMVLDEQRAIDQVAAQAAKLLPTMNASASHEILAAYLRDALRQGDWSVTTKAIEWAEQKGDGLADSVLRQTCSEMGNLREAMSQQLDAYWQRAIQRPPVPRGKGRDQYADWTRNHCICVLILSTCLEFGVRPTRSRSNRHGHKRIPSGISLVKQALERHNIYLEEQTIQRHIWLDLPGELARRAMAAQWPR